MNCRIARKMIALWVGNDLSPSEVANVEDHVIACEDCQEHVEKLITSSDLLGVLNNEKPRNPHDSVWPGLKRQLPARRSAGSRQRGFVKSALVAASLVATAMLLAILPDRIQPANSAGSGVPVSSTPVQNSVSTANDWRDDGFVRYFYDPSWRALERLDSGDSLESSDSVIGRNVGF